MKTKWLRLGSLAMVVALAAVFAFSAAAFAQGPTQTPPLGLGLRLGGPQNSLVAVAAKTLNMNASDLVAALQSGKTIADVAKEKGVATDRIVDTFIANRAQALKTAVDAKRITQAQADAALATMKANVTAHLTEKWSPRGHGLGAGFVDANKDGVCDLCGANGQRGRWTR